MTARLQRRRQLSIALRPHWPFLLVLFGGVVMRTVYWVLYWPGLMFPDSWTYLSVAFQQSPVGMSADRPSGYPAILRVLSLPARKIEWFTAVQHLVGLAVGVLVYHLLRRMGVRRWLATVAAGFVLLDAYTITLEQFVLAEAFFALALVLSAYLSILHRRRTWAVVVSGLLLAGATLIRGTALFAVPVWLAYLVWTVEPGNERRWRTAAFALSSAALPLVAYASLHAAVGRGFNMTEADGWWLYGRVASIADCRQARVPVQTRSLCRPPGDRPHAERTPGFYIWEPESPARQLFPEGPSAQTNQTLRRFAVGIIRANPGDYVALMTRDFVRFFTPSGGAVYADLHLPSRVEPNPDTALAFPREVRARWFPDYRRPGPSDDNPAADYQRFFRTPRLMLGSLLSLTVVALLLPLASRRRFLIRHHRELFLLGTSALAMLVMSVATVDMSMRYLVPIEPLLISAGALAISELGLAWRGRGSRPACAQSRSTGRAEPGPSGDLG